MTTTDLTTTATVVDTVDRYLATWNETDPAQRAELVETSLGADLWYRDAMLEADGLEAYTAMIGAVQESFPGAVMRRTTAVDAHHDVVRFGWALGAPDAEPVFAGIDLAKLDADGKLHRIVGFGGDLTPA
jgi:hypothetical protein